MTFPHRSLVREVVPCVATHHPFLPVGNWGGEEAQLNIKKPEEVSGRNAGCGLVSSPCRIPLRRKKGNFLFSREWYGQFSLKVGYVLCVDWTGWKGKETAVLEACSDTTSILRVSWDTAVAGANLLHCLWVMERKRLSSGANGDTVDFGQPGETSTVAGEENKPRGEILACKGMRKQPTACFNVSSSSSKSALFKCYYLSYEDLEDFRVSNPLASHGTPVFRENL